MHTNNKTDSAGCICVSVYMYIIHTHTHICFTVIKKKKLSAREWAVRGTWGRLASWEELEDGKGGGTLV